MLGFIRKLKAWWSGDDQDPEARAADDAENAVKKVTQGSAEAQQGLYGTGH